MKFQKKWALQVEYHGAQEYMLWGHQKAPKREEKKDKQTNEKKRKEGERKK